MIRARKPVGRTARESLAGAGRVLAHEDTRFFALIAGLLYGASVLLGSVFSGIGNEESQRALYSRSASSFNQSAALAALNAPERGAQKWQDKLGSITYRISSGGMFFNWAGFPLQIFVDMSGGGRKYIQTADSANVAVVPAQGITPRLTVDGSHGCLQVNPMWEVDHSVEASRGLLKAFADNGYLYGTYSTAGFKDLSVTFTPLAEGQAAAASVCPAPKKPEPENAPAPKN